MELLSDGPKRAKRTLVLAHGAGAPMDSPFMEDMAAGVAKAKIRVVRFEFPYMAERRTTGKKRGPDRPAVLLDTWRSVIDALGGGEKLFIGGKSMGGRIASMVADEVGARGLVCLGYPFHAPGRPDRLRVDHLKKLKTPALLLQGTRDTMGSAEEVPGYGLPKRIGLHWLEDGDHSFKPRKKSGRTLEQAMAEAIEATVQFIERVG